MLPQQPLQLIGALLLLDYRLKVLAQEAPELVGALLLLHSFLEVL